MNYRLLSLSTVAMTAVVAVTYTMRTQTAQAGEFDNATPQQAAFLDAFEQGDELTEHSFTTAEGVGASIGEGRIFTRFPRADLDGPTEWANHFPTREGGANATSCIACHNAPFANGAGDIAANVVVDPAHTGDPSLYLERNTLPLFALGIPQRLAEEISTSLYAQRDAGQVSACVSGAAEVSLTAKGVDYGTLQMTRTAQDPCVVEIDAAGLNGIDADLVIRAFGWKGNAATVREFTRGAAHNELGLQAVELVGAQDGDFDGVINELSIVDMTNLTTYMAGLERPVSSIELADLGLIEMSPVTRAMITGGEALFTEIGCTACHVAEMQLENPMFSEPSMTPGFYDVTFPSGDDPSALGFGPETAITFDMMTDQPNNQVENGNKVVHLGALGTNANGFAIARWYTDFRRHDMGPALSDPSDPLGLGAEMFLTRSLAGVGDTGPWLHDGRATTLFDAIALHGGEAADSSNAFITLTAEDQSAVVSFLESLTYYQSEEDH